MAVDNPFLVFPREVRDAIYTYALQDIQYTDALLFKSPYNARNAPLLYLNESIARDVQHLLYKDHAMVLPVTEPSKYKDSEGIAPRVRQCSRMMKQRSNRLIIGTSRFVLVSWVPLLHVNVQDGCSADDWIDMFCGFNNPEPLAKRLIDELISLRLELPSVKVIEFKFFSALNVVIATRWKEYFNQLLEAWPEISIEIEWTEAFESWEHVDMFFRQNLQLLS